MTSAPPGRFDARAIDAIRRVVIIAPPMRPARDLAAPPSLRIVPRLTDLPAQGWDALVPPEARPFLAHPFLSLLEQTGCAQGARGWTPRHLTLWRGPRLVAAAPAQARARSIRRAGVD